MSTHDVQEGRKRVATHLTRIEGQLRDIQTLLRNGAECGEISARMAAARRGLDRAFYEMLACSAPDRAEAGRGVSGLRAPPDKLARMLGKFT